MKIIIQESGIENIASMADIPIAFKVTQILSPHMLDTGLGGILLKEEPIQAPYIKDYDASPGEGPKQWAKHFDVSTWGLLVAEHQSHTIGAAVVAFNTKELTLLKGRNDLAVLWDIRIEPDYRKQGIGTQLFKAVEQWAEARNCIQLNIETQNINVPACKFYSKQGCELSEINRLAYRSHPHEIQLIWTKHIGG